MEPYVVRVLRPLPRFGAQPGDRIYFDPDHADVLVLYRELHIRDTGAILNATETGEAEAVSWPSSSDPRARPALRLFVRRCTASMAASPSGGSVGSRSSSLAARSRAA